MTPPFITTKRRIKRIAPLQLGKIFAILYGIMGLLFLPFLLIISFAAARSGRPPNAAISGVLGFTLLAPFLYAAMGFVFGALGALIYNIVAKWVGGIEVEIE